MHCVVEFMHKVDILGCGDCVVEFCRGLCCAYCCGYLVVNVLFVYRIIISEFCWIGKREIEDLGGWRDLGEVENDCG